MRFSYRMVPEVYQVFWAGMAAGEFINDAAIAAGSYRKQGSRWLAAVGGVRPRRGRNLKGRCLMLAQREEIALDLARGDSIRAIAAIIGRSPSTVSRELRRNADGLGRYRATSAHALAYHRASRPKPAKLLSNLPAPVEMYDTLHGEILRRVGFIDGLLVHIGRATTDGFQVLEVWESKEHYDRANTDIVFPLTRELAGDQPPPLTEPATETFDVRGLEIPSGNIMI